MLVPSTGAAVCLAELAGNLISNSVHLETVERQDIPRPKKTCLCEKLVPVKSASMRANHFLTSSARTMPQRLVIKNVPGGGRDRNVDQKGGGGSGSTVWGVDQKGGGFRVPPCGVWTRKGGGFRVHPKGRTLAFVVRSFVASRVSSSCQRRAPTPQFCGAPFLFFTKKRGPLVLFT